MHRINIIIFSVIAALFIYGDIVALYLLCSERTKVTAKLFAQSLVIDVIFLPILAWAMYLI